MNASKKFYRRCRIIILFLSGGLLPVQGFYCAIDQGGSEIIPMHTRDWNNEETLLTALQNREMRAFMYMYKEFSEDMLIFAYGILENSRQSIQIVDDFFEYLWEKGNFSEIRPPIYKCLMEELRKYCEQKAQGG
jgi:hypothetical protein